MLMQNSIYSATRNPSAPMLLFLGFAKEFSVEIKQEKNRGKFSSKDK